MSDGAAKRLEGLQESLQSQTQSLITYTQEATESVSGVSDVLRNTMEDALHRQGEAVERMQEASLPVEEAIDGLHAALAELRVFVKTLHESEESVSRIVASSRELSAATKPLFEADGKMAERQKAYAKSLEQLAKVTNEVDQKLEERQQSYAKMIADLSSASTKVASLMQQRSREFARTANEALNDLKGRSNELLSGTGQSLRQLQEHSKALTEQIQTLRSASDKLIEAGPRGRAVPLNLKHARTAFFETAGEMVEKLNGLALNMHDLLNIDVPPALLSAINAGDRSAIARRLPRLKRGDGNRAIVFNYENDYAFREVADRYMHQFEELMEEAGNVDENNRLSSLFLTSDVGRLYLILARDTGRAAA